MFRMKMVKECGYVTNCTRLVLCSRHDVQHRLALGVNVVLLFSHVLKKTSNVQEKVFSDCLMCGLMS